MTCVGIDMLIKVNTGTIAAPVWKSIGGQRGATLNRSTNAVDVTTKDSDRWEENRPGNKSWSVDSDGVMVKNDEAYTALVNAWKNDEQVQLYIVRADLTIEKGMATITDFPEDGPYDAEATYSVSFAGSGKLEEV